jgi:alginate O-acetyltransferase complex protein AlgJ
MNETILDRGARLASEVVIGRDGMLFHRFHRGWEQVIEGVPLAERDLRHWVNTLEYRYAWCRMLDIPYFVLVVPERHVVYDDHLPEGLQVASDRPIRQLRRALSPAVRRALIYPVTELKAARRREPTFFQTDIHPSRWGMYILYRALAERVGPALVPVPIPETELARDEQKRRMIGDMGIRLPEEPIEEFAEIRVHRRPRASCIYENRSFAEGQVQVWKTEDDRLPRMVMFRDSNATHIIDPYLLASFSRIVSVGGAGYFFPELVRDERPDVVVTCMAERYLGWPGPDGTASPVALPEGQTSIGMAEFAGVTLPLPA